MPKFFVTPQDIVGKKITLTQQNQAYISSPATSHRAREGEEITVCDGEGMDYQCRILSLERGVVTEVFSSAPCDVEPETKITLYQGLPKVDKMEWIIQKCVELGIERIVPVSTERAIVKLDKKEGKKLERWQKIAEAAAKQSGRGIIPQMGESVLSFKEAVAEAAKLDGALIPYEKEEERGIRQFVQGFSGKTVGVFIGPEGGFAPEEIQLAQEAGILPVTLGKRILRTETAGMTTVALLLYELG